MRMELNEIYNGLATLSLDDLYKAQTELRRQIKNRGSRQFDELKIGDKVEVVKRNKVELVGTIVTKRKTKILVKDNATGKQWVCPPEMLRKVS